MVNTSLTSWLASYASEIIASILIAIAGFIVGTFRRTIVHRFRTRRTRKYWEPFKSRGLVLVLGSYTSGMPLSTGNPAHRPIDASALYDFEPYGFVGFGDVLALMTLQEHLKSLNWNDVVIAHSKDLRAARQRNLVLIGGPDANPITDLAMQHGQVPVAFEEAPGGRTQMRVAFRTASPDSTVDEVYVPVVSSDSPPALTRDYGFVAHVPNPYADESTAILLVGVYGAATAAAAQLVTSSYGVSRIMRLQQRKRCIAVFRTDVGRDGDVASPRIELCAPLSE